jgi:hypothetical protein
MLDASTPSRQHLSPETRVQVRSLNNVSDGIKVDTLRGRDDHFFAAVNKRESESAGLDRQGLADRTTSLINLLAMRVSPPRPLERPASETHVVAVHLNPRELGLIQPRLILQEHVQVRFLVSQILVNAVVVHDATTLLSFS